MGDFLEGCNDQRIPTNEFMDLFCKRCRNRDCVHAGWAVDRFSTRIATQEERMFNPERADPKLPKYAQIIAADFRDMLAQAMALEVSEKRGDWEIPEIPVLDGVEEAVKMSAALQEPAPKGTVAAPQARPPAQAPPTPPKMSSVAVTLTRGNTEVPARGVMIDGSPAPAPNVLGADPWAAPVRKDVKIPVGGKVKMGGGQP